MAMKTMGVVPEWWWRLQAVRMSGVRMSVQDQEIVDQMIAGSPPTLSDQQRETLDHLFAKTRAR